MCGEKVGGCGRYLCKSEFSNLAPDSWYAVGGDTLTAADIFYNFQQILHPTGNILFSGRG